MKSIKQLIKNPLFIVGLLVKLTMLMAVFPQAAIIWYVPFMEASIQSFTFDPWHQYALAGGEEAAFPYGYVMWLILSPLAYVCKVFGISGNLGYGFTILIADMVLLVLLKNLFQTKNTLLLGVYWLSPIVLFAAYWLGFNDLIPVTLLFSAIYCLRNLKPVYAGIFCGAAVSAKLSMVLPIPFFCLYLFCNQSLRHLLFRYMQGLVASSILFSLPFLMSQEAIGMLLHNPEMAKTYQFSLQFGDDFKIYVLPLAYLLMLYTVWRIRRISFELFHVILGITFLLVVLLTPAAPGWFLWVIPVLVYYQARARAVGIVFVAGVSSLYVISNFLDADQPIVFGSAFGVRLAEYINEILGVRGINLLHTAMTALGIVLLIRIWRDTVSENDYFRLSRKPLVVGIAGDSGAGKDWLSNSLRDLFGGHSVVQMSGDDYHLWDRHKPMWQVMTHLNPRANDIERFAQDLMALIDRKPVMARYYDHTTGRMSHPRKIESNDFIIASGLHSLHLPILRNCYDLSVYLDIDEDLRRFFKLRRDVHERGNSLEKVQSSIEKRMADAVKFVRPQAAHADLIMSLQPINPRLLEDANTDQHIRYKLSVRSRNGLSEESLARVLVGVCGLHVDMEMLDETNEVELVIEGETTGDDIELAARTLFPNMRDFLDTSPSWKDGVEGLMQLITLSHINQALSKRLL